jgi:hypothetical protein
MLRRGGKSVLDMAFETRLFGRNYHARPDSQVLARWLEFVCFDGIVVWFAVVRRLPMWIS